MTHLDIYHKEILKNISKESEAHLLNQVQKKISPNESQSDGEKLKVKNLMHACVWKLNSHLIE